ncbi:MAG: hypothetical protein JKX85_01120, partial [Phycisphaeraceae bacterium]|nr:hypothetical protein [Phycisphaeraceae bacterium]
MGNSSGHAHKRFSRYNSSTMGLILDIAYMTGLAVSSPVWGYKMLATGKWRTDWAGRLGKGQTLAKLPGQRTILLHAVSLGETNSSMSLRIRLVSPTLTACNKIVRC